MAKTICLRPNNIKARS